MRGGYRIRWPIPGTDRRGQESGFPTMDLAEARLAQIRLELANEKVFGAQSRVVPITIAGYLPKFLERLRQRGSSLRTLALYSGELSILAEVVGEEWLHRISREKAVRIQERARVGKKGPVSAQTANDRITKLSTMFQSAVEDGHATENPFRGLRKFRVRRREFDLMNYADRERYLAAMRPDVRDFAEFTMETGLRQGEMFRMRKSEVFVAQRRIVTRVRKNVEPLWTGLTNRALSIVERRIEMSPDEYVWPWRHRGDGFSAQWRASRKRLVALGIEPLWPHAWRHIFAATHAEGGASVPEIARFLGVTTETAHRYHDHARGGWIDRGVERLERLREIEGMAGTG